MNEQRINKLINDLFYDIVECDAVRDQKEELRTHLTERVNDYMAAGLSFEESLYAAKESLGDPEELVSGFERKRAVVLDNVDDEYGLNINVRFNRPFAKLVPLSPFIYVILGLTQHMWAPEWWTWGWWTWGWVIIPITAILSSGLGLHKMPALSPFIYILLGVFLGWWAWGWLIIPISAIVFTSNSKKKKKKKKKKARAQFIEIEKDGQTIIIDKNTGVVEVERRN